jgi:hypothetical protein
MADPKSQKTTEQRIADLEEQNAQLKADLAKKVDAPPTAEPAAPTTPVARYFSFHPAYIGGVYYNGTMQSPIVVDLDPDVEPSRKFQPLNDLAVKALQKLENEDAEEQKRKPVTIQMKKKEELEPPKEEKEEVNTMSQMAARNANVVGAPKRPNDKSPV